MGCSFKEKSSSTSNCSIWSSHTSFENSMCNANCHCNPCPQAAIIAWCAGASSREVPSNETQLTTFVGWDLAKLRGSFKKISYLELATSIYKRFVQSDDSKSLQRKWWLFHHFHPFETGCFGFQVHWFKKLLESQLPSLKQTFSHLKMDGWKVSFPLGTGLFSGAKMLVSGG